LPALGVIVVAPVAGYHAIDLWLYQKAHDRADQMRNGLADSIDLLTISVEAGLGFDAALAHVAKNTKGPLAMEFARVLHQMQLGMGRSESLRALGARSKLDEIRSFTSAMIQADAFGIPIGKVLRIQSAEMRTKRRQYAEEKAAKVPVMMMMPLMFFILPTLFIVVIGPSIIGLMESL
jgi:tight adherence protein C